MKTSFEIVIYLPPILPILNSIVLKLNNYKTLCRGYLLFNLGIIVHYRFIYDVTTLGLFSQFCKINEDIFIVPSF